MLQRSTAIHYTGIRQQYITGIQYQRKAFANLQLDGHIVHVELADVRHVVRVNRHDGATFAVWAFHCSQVQEAGGRWSLGRGLGLCLESTPAPDTLVPPPKGMRTMLWTTARRT